MNKKILEKRLLEAIVEELNRKQGVPLSFMAVTLEKVSENHFKGTVSNPQS